MKNYKKNGGFLYAIILIVVALIILSYIGFDVKKFLYSPTVMKIFNFVWNAFLFVLKLLIGLLKTAWGVVLALWAKIQPSIQSLQK